MIKGCVWFPTFKILTVKFFYASTYTFTKVSPITLDLSFLKSNNSLFKNKTLALLKITRQRAISYETVWVKTCRKISTASPAD